MGSPWYKEMVFKKPWEKIKLLGSPTLNNGNFYWRTTNWAREAGMPTMCWIL